MSDVRTDTHTDTHTDTRTDTRPEPRSETRAETRAEIRAEARAEGRTIVKTTVNLPEAAIHAVEILAAKRGTTMADVIRRAISTEKFLNDAVEAGGNILIEDKDKRLKQLVIR
jgi:hypothetical protein